MGTTVLLGMVFSFAATLVLTPLCTDLLLFKDPPRGAPRWWHVIGTVWVAAHLGASELFLYYALRPILKIISPRTADERLRRATSWMARGVVKGEQAQILAREVGVCRQTVQIIRQQLQANALVLQPDNPLDEDEQTETDELYQNAGEKK